MDKYVQKFKEAYEKKTGNIISDSDALTYFHNLVVLVDAVYKPIPKNICMTDTVNNAENV